MTLRTLALIHSRTPHFALTVLRRRQLWQPVHGLLGYEPLVVQGRRIREAEEGRYERIVETAPSISISDPVMMLGMMMMMLLMLLLLVMMLLMMLVMMMIKLMKVRKVAGNVSRVPVRESVHLSGSAPSSAFLPAGARARAVEVCARLGEAAGHPAPRLAAQVRHVADDLLVAAPRLAVAGQRGSRLVELPGALL